MNKYGKRRMAEKRDVQNQRDFGKYFALIVVIVFTVFIGRFLYIAVTKKVSGNNLVEIANQTYHEKSTLKASRGTIYDASGQPIVEDTKRYSIYVVLSKTAVAYGQKLYLKNSDKTRLQRFCMNIWGWTLTSCCHCSVSRSIRSNSEKGTKHFSFNKESNC